MSIKQAELEICNAKQSPTLHRSRDTNRLRIRDLHYPNDGMSSLFAGASTE